ncbi:hypothetical protein [Sphingobium sp. EM0848]|uniref:hypothetical protein n=1 Tax=Sphingobium sp. EM0848 TaxID=2743473 RepID=UPI00159C7E44|nr:hypothetical protein [Sphingobium sp. EM0848]
MFRPIWLLGILTFLSVAPVAVKAAPFDSAPIVKDERLATVRGGFLLPNGMDILLGITVDTLINGQRVLSTVMTLDDASHMAVYTGGDVQQQSGTTQLLVPGANGSTLVRITQGDASVPGNGGGQPLAVLPNAAPVETPWGTVQLVQSDGQSTVYLQGDGLQLRQMIGAVTGALVANTANDRVIDTTVTVDLDVRHSAIPTAAMMLRLDNLLAGAATRGGF